MYTGDPPLSTFFGCSGHNGVLRGASMSGMSGMSGMSDNRDGDG